MIEISKMDIFGFHTAIRGMRNPMNSWNKQDSYCIKECCDCSDHGACPAYNEIGGSPLRHEKYVGPNDFYLMMHLAKSGHDHAKFRRMIGVSMDIKAPLYWWKEFDTYKVGTVANSCSTMHKLTYKNFEWSDFSTEHIIGNIGKDAMRNTIDAMNRLREKFINAQHNNDPKSKELWYEIIQIMPASYNQLRTVTLNYEVLANIYPNRKTHKLQEWRDFCEMIKTLPYSQIITLEEDIHE